MVLKAKKILIRNTILFFNIAFSLSKKIHFFFYHCQSNKVITYFSNILTYIKVNLLSSQILSLAKHVTELKT